MPSHVMECGWSATSCLVNASISLLLVATTAPLFNYLAPSESADEKMMSLIFASWNQIGDWMRRLDDIRQAA